MIINVAIILLTCVLINYVRLQIIKSFNSYNPDLVQMDVLDTESISEDLESKADTINT
jgi:hypothetical protein